ncbi:MAG: peptide ABC transporter substrate-binding protein [Candidatus Dormibacteraeota bacterium]|nr:peptide ABC transporter substrate-binding protein [Candidatus Dormibacteraeota bacterium]
MPASATTTLRGLVAGLAAALALSGCQSSVPGIVGGQLAAAHGGGVVEALVGPDQVLNPLFEQTDNDREIDSLIYQGLTTAGAGEAVRLQLAASMTVSSDRLSYTFGLRRGVRWADGRPFTADDVLFTFQTMQAADYSVPTQQLWRDITVEKVDATTVRFTLKAPSASFPLALRQGIIPAHVFNGENAAQIRQDQHSAARAFGTGPFRVRALSADRQKVVLERNDQASPRPLLDTFEFHSYPSLGDAVDAVSRGDADTVGALNLPTVPGLSRRPDLGVRQIPTYDFVAVMFNLDGTQASVLSPPEVRQALAKAVNRQRIVTSILDGRADVASGPVPPTVWAFAPSAASRNGYDPAAAGRLLDQAGWTLDQASGLRMKAGQPLQLTLVTPDGYPYKQVAGEIQSDFKAVGVTLTVQPVSLPALVSQYLMGKQFQLALAAVDNGPDPDQYPLWHSGAASDSINFAGPMMPHQALIDKDLEDGRGGGDRPSRAAAYTDFQDLMAQAAPAIFLFEPHYSYVISKRVRGVSTNPVIEPVDRLGGAAGWFVNTKGS